MIEITFRSVEQWLSLGLSNFLKYLLAFFLFTYFGTIWLFPPNVPMTEVLIFYRTYDFWKVKYLLLL